jgi:hypothetical protein
MKALLAIVASAFALSAVAQAPAKKEEPKKEAAKPAAPAAAPAAPAAPAKPAEKK